MQQMILSTVLRSLAAVIIGGIIGSERARHGRNENSYSCLSRFLYDKYDKYVRSRYDRQQRRCVQDTCSGDIRHRLFGRRYDNT